MAILSQQGIESLHPDLVIRADANEQVGSGHVMRCIAIAEAVERCGGEAIFAVSQKESADALHALARDCVVLGGSSVSFGEKDGKSLGRFCKSIGASSVLVDSYAVTDTFFESLRGELASSSRVVWIDDLYTYELEDQIRPVCRSVDCVVNYSLGISLTDYELAYEGKDTQLCIDPSYAPLRNQFRRDGLREYGDVKRMMVTSGSTNEGKLLEKMTSACLQANPSACVDVIVGSMSEFSFSRDSRVIEHRGIDDLSPYMRACDICVSAAGTTIYELCSIGVPSVIIPVVDNQSVNAAGFERLGLGIVVDHDAVFEDHLIEAVRSLSANADLRESYASKMQGAIDGEGADRLAKMLYVESDIEHMLDR